MVHQTDITRAAELVRDSDCLLILAGAGMSVDSGLPDFRGNEGFWRAYPPYRSLGLSFTDMARSEWFNVDPRMAWGFYGHRLQLYRKTVPHAGYTILNEWAKHRSHFVVTSNVDGAFLRSGFNATAISELHGSINWLQCPTTHGHMQMISDEDVLNLRIDESTMRACDQLPQCHVHGSDCRVRPNVLMFNDRSWNQMRFNMQEDNRLEFMLKATRAQRHVILEIGAGVHVPTIRMLSYTFAKFFSAPLIRINPDVEDSESNNRTVDLVAVKSGALEALSRMDRLVR